MNKFGDKDRRRQRRNFNRNHIARDLESPKYHQRVIERKRTEDELVADRFHEDEVGW